MRLDKFLKITRIIKRRTVAKELADNGNISINSEEKKSSYNVKKGDILDIKYFNKNIKVRIATSIILALLVAVDTFPLASFPSANIPIPDSAFKFIVPKLVLFLILELFRNLIFFKPNRKQ